MAPLSENETPQTHNKSLPDARREALRSPPPALTAMTIAKPPLSNGYSNDLRVLATGFAPRLFMKNGEIVLMIFHRSEAGAVPLSFSIDGKEVPFCSHADAVNYGPFLEWHATAHPTQSGMVKIEELHADGSRTAIFERPFKI